MAMGDSEVELLKHAIANCSQSDSFMVPLDKYKCSCLKTTVHRTLFFEWLSVINCPANNCSDTNTNEELAGQQFRLLPNYFGSCNNSGDKTQFKTDGSMLRES